MEIKHPEIYKQDTKGKTRVWYLEQLGPQYRTVAGLHGGNLVTSDWTTCVGKQGRTDVEQADFEVAAAYKNKLTREYHSSLEAIGGGAHFFKPMLAQEYKGWQGPGHAQFKYDGMRCIATKDGLFSRQGKPIVSCPHIHNQLKFLFNDQPELVLDGEIYSHALHDDFGQLMSLARQTKPTADDLEKSAAVLEYHVYDIPSHDGIFSARLDLLEFLVVDGLPSIKLAPTSSVTSAEEYDTFHASALEQGYEGTIFRLDAAYEQKRSKSLLKRKDFVTDEFEVVSIDEGIGNWSGVAKSVTCRLPDGRTFGAGIRGSKERAAELLNETYRWVTVRYFQLSPDLVPRFPVVIDFHAEARID